MSRTNPLAAEFERIQALIPKYQITAASVSAGGVGWHLDHSLMVIIGVLQTLEASEPSGYKWSFRLPRIIVMNILGKIPRGKARAPKAVVPAEEASAALLGKKLAKAKQLLESAVKLPANKWFEHPYFGHMRRDDTFKFLGIHTRHHLDIADDILTAG